MEEPQHTRSKQTIQQLYDNVLPALAQHLHRHLEAVIPLFNDFTLERLIDTRTKDPGADPEAEVSVENGNVRQLGLRLRLEGFQRAGVEAFDLAKDLLLVLDRHRYFAGPDSHHIWLEKEYGEGWQQQEYEAVAERWSEELIDALTQQLESKMP